MINENFFCFVIAIFVVIFIWGYLGNQYQPSEYVKIARKITASTADKLKEEKGLNCIGTGGQMMDDIQMMMMGFYYYQVVDINQARQLVVGAAEEYLSAINSNEHVRPYLHNYPFTADNIEIVIYFNGPDRREVPLGEITVAGTDRGKIYYYIRDSETKALETLFEENYEEGFKTVNGSG